MPSLDLISVPRAKKDCHWLLIVVYSLYDVLSSPSLQSLPVGSYRKPFLILFGADSLCSIFEKNSY